MWRLFGDGPFRAHKDENLMMGLVPLEKNVKESNHSLSALRGWGYIKKVAVCKPGREPAPEPSQAVILTWNLWAFRTVRNTCLSFKPPGLGYFATAAQATTVSMRQSLQKNCSLVLVERELGISGDVIMNLKLIAFYPLHWRLNLESNLPQYSRKGLEPSHIDFVY